MAEGARLESVYRLIPIEGSNPSLSASLGHGYKPYPLRMKSIALSVLD